MEDKILEENIEERNYTQEIFDLIRKIETIGSDLDFGFPRGFSRIGSPSVYVPELSVAGK